MTANNIADNVNSVIDEIKKSAGHMLSTGDTLYRRVDYCCATPSNSNLKSANDKVHDLWMMTQTLSKVLLGDRRYLYGEWGDKDPGETASVPRQTLCNILSV
jgi:hypothetical protein